MPVFFSLGVILYNIIVQNMISIIRLKMKEEIDQRNFTIFTATCFIHFIIIVLLIPYYIGSLGCNNNLLTNVRMPYKELSLCRMVCLIL